jgi:D-amino acid aminotransferase
MTGETGSVMWADVGGEVVPAAEAKVSVWDMGFLFGDEVFEAVRIHRGKPVLWGVHCLRLLASARGIGLERMPGADDLLRRVEVLIERSRLAKGTIYIQVSRGCTCMRSDTEMPAEPTVFIAVDSHTCLPEDKYEKGVGVITFEDIRWRYANLKTTNLLPRTLARVEANKLGAHEAVFKTPDGKVFEGTSTNLFVLKAGRLSTPPLSERLLAGATRAALLPLARRVAREVREEDVSVTDLLDADEVMLVGTTTEVLGVVRVDGQQIGDGRVGRVARELRRLYQAEVLEKA